MNKLISLEFFACFLLSLNASEAAAPSKPMIKEFQRTTRCALEKIKSGELSKQQVSYLAWLVTEAMENSTLEGELSASELCQNFQGGHEATEFDAENNRIHPRVTEILSNYWQEPESYYCRGINFSADLAMIRGVGIRSGFSRCTTNNFRLYPLVHEASIHYTMGLGAVVGIWGTDQSDRELNETDGPGLTSGTLSLGAGIHLSDKCRGGEGGLDIDCAELNGAGLGLGMISAVESKHTVIKLYPMAIDWKGIYKYLKMKP